MNVLFAAHIIGDFLLQPKWMVDLKEKHTFGVAVHAICHAGMMALFILPNSFRAAAVIISIAIIHGIIDRAKVLCQNQKGLLLSYFFLDQLLHFAVLVGAALLFPIDISIFWQSEAGKGMLILAMFFSFSVAWWNLANIPKYSKGGGFEKAKLFLTLAATFLMFTIPLLASRF